MLKPESIHYQTIGHFHGAAEKRYDVPRQSSLQQHQGFIRLHRRQQFEQALEDLPGMERLWVLYHFHLNATHWKPKVNTPRTKDGKKKSVFATRAPYRPNPIGISCVKIEKIDGLKIWVSECDLLEGTPILDIKPYIPYADSFPQAQTGWLENMEEEAFALSYSPLFEEQLQWMAERSTIDFKNYIERNLEYQPTNTRHKRVRIEGEENTYHLALKTWRIFFHLDLPQKKIHVLKLFPGYSIEKLQVELSDPHLDKALHKDFIQYWKEVDIELQALDPLL